MHRGRLYAHIYSPHTVLPKSTGREKPSNKNEQKNSNEEEETANEIRAKIRKCKNKEEMSNLQ